MELREIAESFVLGALSANDLPKVAADALEVGYDSPSLRELAGAGGADSDYIANLFHKVLEELAVPTPKPAEAALAAAKRIAGAIVIGSIDPYEGAKRIWTSIYQRFPQLSELRSFAGFASEYEDDERHREDYARLIREESAKLSQV